MPELRIEQTYSVKYLNVSDRWHDPIALTDARTTILRRALSSGATPSGAVSYEVDDTDALRVTVSTTDSVVALGQINSPLFDAVLHYLDEILIKFGDEISKAARKTAEMLSPRFPENDIHVNCGLTRSPWYSDHIFSSSQSRAPVTRSVTFDVPRAVGAAVRRSDRLQDRVRGAVIDRNSYAGHRTPDPLDCTIELLPTGALRLGGPAGAVQETVRALLSSPVNQPAAHRVIDTWPTPAASYLAFGNLAVALVAIALSPAPAVLGWLIVLASVIAVALGCTFAVAHRNGVSTSRLVLGLLPAGIIVAFALFYGGFVHGTHPGVSVGHPAPHLVDLFLLSFGVASTGGFLDLGLHGRPVRIGAFIETLTLVSVAGSSLYVASKSVMAHLAEVTRRQNQG